MEAVASDVAPGQGREREQAAARPRNRGLLLVGLFKLSKVLFFSMIGITALKLLHRNVGDLVMRISGAIPLDPQGHFVSLIMDRADLIGSHQLRMVSMSSLGYAAVCLVEGIGLLKEKVWAEYLTLVLTTLALPVEFLELLRDPTAWKATLIAANVLVVLYLLYVVRRGRRRAALGA